MRAAGTLSAPFLLASCSLACCSGGIQGRRRNQGIEGGYYQEITKLSSNNPIDMLPLPMVLSPSQWQLTLILLIRLAKTASGSLLRLCIGKSTVLRSVLSSKGTAGA